MGWLARRSRPALDAPGASAAEDGSRDSGLLEALAAVLRAFGEHAIELEDPSQEDFPARCEAWARHLLLRAPPPVGPDLPDPSQPEPPAAKHALGDLRRFFTERRTLEHRYLTESLDDLRSTLLTLVTRIRAAAQDDAKSAARVSEELETLGAVADRLTLSELRAQVRNSVEIIGAQMEAQRGRRDEQVKALAEQLRQMRTDLHAARGEARRDPLTGLDNRKSLDESLDRYVSLAEASGEPLVAVMVDLDHFKRVNDEHGHAAGDAVLVAAAGVLVRCFLRKCDLLCRYGGEELCVLLPSTSLDDAARLTERLLDRLRAARIEHKGQAIRVTASAGLAALTPGEPGTSLLDRADAALYAAKRAGRDRLELARAV